MRERKCFGELCFGGQCMGDILWGTCVVSQCDGHWNCDWLLGKCVAVEEDDAWLKVLIGDVENSVFLVE